MLHGIGDLLFILFFFLIFSIIRQTWVSFMVMLCNSFVELCSIANFIIAGISKLCCSWCSFLDGSLEVYEPCGANMDAWIPTSNS